MRIEKNILDSGLQKDQNKRKIVQISFDNSKDFEFLTTPVILREEEIKKRLGSADSEIIQPKNPHLKYNNEENQDEELKAMKKHHFSDTSSHDDSDSEENIEPEEELMEMLKRKPLFSFPLDQIVCFFSFFWEFLKLFSFFFSKELGKPNNLGCKRYKTTRT